MTTIRTQVNSEMHQLRRGDRRRAHPPRRPAAGEHPGDPARMQSERQRVAAQARAEGAATSIRIHADADRERTVLLAEARAQADQLRGEGEATAIKLYADAYDKDPQFFGVWRTLEAYRDQSGNGPDAACADAGRCDPALSAGAAHAAGPADRAGPTGGDRTETVRPLSAAGTRPISRKPHIAPSSREFSSMSRCLSRSVRTALAVALALPLVSLPPVLVPAPAAARGGAGQLRRPRGEAAAGGGEHGILQPRWHPQRRRSGAGNPDVSARARRSSSSSRTSSTATARRPGRQAAASRHRNGACRASAPASSSIPPASS